MEEKIKNFLEKDLKEKLMKIVSNHDFIIVDFIYYSAIGNVEFHIVGNDYFPFELFTELEMSLGRLSTLSPAVIDGQNSFKLVLRLF